MQVSRALSQLSAEGEMDGRKGFAVPLFFIFYPILYICIQVFSAGYFQCVFSVTLSQCSVPWGWSLGTATAAAFPVACHWVWPGQQVGHEGRAVGLEYVSLSLPGGLSPPGGHGVGQVHLLKTAAHSLTAEQHLINAPLWPLQALVRGRAGLRPCRPHKLRPPLLFSLNPAQTFVKSLPLTLPCYPTGQRHLFPGRPWPMSLQCSVEKIILRARRVAEVPVTAEVV